MNVTDHIHKKTASDGAWYTLAMEEEPKSNGENRNSDGTFADGNPGGPGRPKGSVSIVAKIKAKFEEDPEYFEEWINKLLEDPSNRKAVMEQIEGKPKQSVELD